MIAAAASLARRLAWVAGGEGAGRTLAAPFAIAAGGYAALAALGPMHADGMRLCAGGAGILARAGAALTFALATRLTPRAVAGDLLMLAAMTAPLLIAPLGAVAARSFPRRRARSVALAAAGYLAVWLAALAVLDLALAAAMAAGAEARLSLLAATGLAAAWQLSPARTGVLRAAHLAPALAPFGPAADRACLGYGLARGLACAGACAPAMAAAMLAPIGWLACLGVGAAAFLERLRPHPPQRALALALLAGGLAQAALL